MRITIPAVQLETLHSSGNKFYHYLTPEADAEGQVTSVTQSFLTFTSESSSFCFTGNEAIADSDCRYIAKCSKAIKTENLVRNRLHFTRWIKHPLLQNYTPESVLATWNNSFNFLEENLAENRNGLRTPQVGAIHAILAHFKLQEEIGTVVLPTGTGKTETMLSVLVAKQCTKLLVVVPSDPLRDQLSDKFKRLGYLKRFGIVDDTAVNPIVGVLTTKFDSIDVLEDFFARCNVIVSTMNIVAGSDVDQISRIAQLCSHLFVDEAHHSKAATWEKFIRTFDKGKVILFTATPYRNDGERLDGKIIFNFSLRKAQEQGYFKEIRFIPIREYDPDIADQLIADKAVEKLRQDRAAGLNHILMARCENKDKADRIFELYRRHTDLNPIVIYSSLPGKQRIVNQIKNLEHSIIVCVDMLGEGFDLPQLKVAAFHDIRKSLPITLQFAGRFTRTSLDDTLGNASFIANLYQPGVSDELEQLYAKDANWNVLLPGISARSTQEQIDFQEFLAGFRNLNDSLIPFQNIRPALSTVVYRNLSSEWSPGRFAEGIPNYDSYTHKFSSYNSDERAMVILLGREVPVEWGNFSEIANIEWSLIVMFWESRNNLLFIHGSDKGGHFKELAKAVLGPEHARLIQGMDVFKVFHDLHRVQLYNVGLRKVIGKDLSFQSYIGKSVGEAINYLTRRQGMKNNVFGVGFSDGEKVSLGCSQKGRIWSYSRGNIRELIGWCKKIGDKLINSDIDPDVILQGTLRPEAVSVRPQALPIYVDWDNELYSNSEEYFKFRTAQKTYDLSSCELRIVNPTITGPLQFAFHTDDFDAIFELGLSERQEGDETIVTYVIRKLSGTLVTVVYGNKSAEIEDFLNEYTPLIWFADGSFLEGNYHVILQEEMLPLPIEQIVSRNWNGVNLRNESQHVNPKIVDSIQYNFITSLITEDFDIVYDDDYAGEIADVIAIKNNEDVIDINLYHLKYAIDGRVGNDIGNLYEVCGQAQKSIHWKYREPSEFYDHLLRRTPKSRNGHTCSRIEKGTVDDIELLMRIAKSSKPTKFHVYIVQPSVSRSNVSEDILLLLGVTASYLKDTAGINLIVIGSD